AHELVHEAPYIVYPGNLQGRHARETGPKGAVFLEVVDQRVSALEHRALDVVRWARLRVDVTGLEGREAVEAKAREALEEAVDAAEGRLLAARLELCGVSPLHGQLSAER